ncbi:MAG: YeaC family protein [Yersinia sp. (in: enterobacteria)]
MEFEDLISVMTPEIYQRLMQAVELGKWPNGVVLTPEQKENSLQMVMLWRARYNEDAQHMSIGTDGQIMMKTRQELKQQFGCGIISTDAGLITKLSPR